jgi:hypothetical protein
VSVASAAAKPAAMAALARLNIQGIWLECSDIVASGAPRTTFVAPAALDGATGKRGAPDGADGGGGIQDGSGVVKRARVDQPRRVRLAAQHTPVCNVGVSALLQAAQAACTPARAPARAHRRCSRPALARCHAQLP